MMCFISTDAVSSRITLDRKLGSGGEGTVYSITGDTTRCVKLYHDKKRTPELEAKLKAMIEAPPKDPTLAAGHYSICWPQGIVYEDDACTTFIGFIMPLIDTAVFREYHLLCDKPGATSSVCYRLENFGTGFTYLHMYVVALNLASCVAAIHEAGHAIGDLNDKNILVSTKDSKITIVDCDSFEIHGTDNQVFPCSVYMPEYSAPEVIKHEKIENRQYSDRFALAVLIFKLLMLNTHPYASRGSSVEHLNTPGEKIADGYYPYEEYENLEVFPPTYALPYDIIPPYIKGLFKKCFTEGHHKPKRRPSAKLWFEVIKDMYQQMFELVRNDHVQCTKNPLHMFPLHLAECPWCKMKDDYFPQEYVNTKAHHTDMKNRVFNYLNDLLNYYAVDGKITKEEYEKFKEAAKTEYLTDDAIESVFMDYSNKNPKLMMGEGVAVSQCGLVFEKSKDSYVSKKSVSIINMLMHENIYIIINVVNSPFLSISKNKIMLKPSEKIEIEVSIDFKYYSPISEHYNLPLNIEWSSKSYSGMKNIPIIILIKESGISKLYNTIANNNVVYLLGTLVVVFLLSFLFIDKDARIKFIIYSYTFLPIIILIIAFIRDDK